MTFFKLIKFSIIYALLQSIVFYVFQAYIWQQIVGDWYIFWILQGIVVLACIRRLGVIMFLEFYYVMFIWIVLRVIADLCVTYGFHGSFGIFGVTDYWWSYGAVLLAAGAFHKKRHVAVRRGDMKL